MTTVLQRTFGEVVGFDSVVPTRPHPNDEVVCEDTGESRALRDCLIAADGTAFADESERFDHEVELVRDILKGCIEWDDEYRKSDDCTDDYHFLVGENSSTLAEALVEWADSHTDSDSDDYPFGMREAVCEDMLEQMEVKILEGYITYGAPDVVLADYECGETEIQVDIDNNDILMALVARDELEEILEELESDFCISATRKPVKVDGKVVRWEHDCYVSGGCFNLMNDTDFRYVFGLSDEAMIEIWEEHTEKVDCRLYKVDGEFFAELFYDVDDFDSKWIRGKVAKRHKSDSAEFVAHHDYASESASEHRELLTALAGIMKKASAEYPTTSSSNAIIKVWAEDALADAENDFADRYPNEECV